MFAGLVVTDRYYSHFLLLNDTHSLNAKLADTCQYLQYSHSGKAVSCLLLSSFLLLYGRRNAFCLVEKLGELVS
jgi:hypothetical protein